MKLKIKDGKIYILINIGRDQTMWKESKFNKFIAFIKSLIR